MASYDKEGNPAHSIDWDAIDYLSKTGTPVLLGQYEPDYTVLDILENAQYELGERLMKITDPVWGSETLGNDRHDDMFIELARTPLFRRSQAIEQLTLGPEYATMPNSMYFSRWQHIWGSLAFVRKMTEGDQRYDERERTVLQMRTLVSDLGHTSFSHLGDWIFQGRDGGEDMHDQELRQILEISGVADIIDSHGFTVEEVAFPDKEDFVESPSPGLCVDRVDYGLRELLRWSGRFLPILTRYKTELSNPKLLFEIDDNNQLICKNERFASAFAAGYGLLPTEHWGHPIHRLQLDLFESSVKAILVKDVAGMGEHPRDVMYGIDADVSGYYRTWDVVLFDKLMRDIAKSQRTIFAEARVHDLSQIFSRFMPYDKEDIIFPQFPDPLKAYSWQSELYGEPYPIQVIVEEAEGVVDKMEASGKGLVLDLPPLKARSIDPLIRVDDTILPLSQRNESYARYLDGQQAMMARSYRATILMRPDVAERIKATLDEINSEWAKAIVRPRDPSAMEHRIRDAEILAAARSFDHIREVDDEEISQRLKQLGRKSIEASE